MVKAILFTGFFVLVQASLALLFPLSWSRFLLCFVLYGGGTLVILYLLFHPRCQWLVSNRSQVPCHDGPCVALTFDDGPSPASTPRLLDILTEKEVKATFFVIARRAEAEADLLRRIRDDGHRIANHTYSHPPLFCFLSPRRLREEIVRCQEALQRICGVRPRHFRSPVGLRHPLLETYLERERLEYVSWRVRSFDTFVQKPEALKNRIAKRVEPGDIILMHDGGNPGAGVMLDVLPDVIDELRNRGFVFVLV